jgi:hypothetical protein
MVTAFVSAACEALRGHGARQAIEEAGQGFAVLICAYSGLKERVRS